jgi:hypothetical protein
LCADTEQFLEIFQFSLDKSREPALDLTVPVHPLRLQVGLPFLLHAKVAVYLFGRELALGDDSKERAYE